MTTESGVTVIGNSIWGAMGNADGIEAAFWSAICGRTPRWGNHVFENRAATHLVQVETPIEGMLEWDLLGKVIGGKLLKFVLLTAKQQKQKNVYLHAQVSAIPFYKKHGFTACGDVFYEANIPHREMSKKIC